MTKVKRPTKRCRVKSCFPSTLTPVSQSLSSRNNNHFCLSFQYSLLILLSTEDLFLFLFNISYRSFYHITVH